LKIANQRAGATVAGATVAGAAGATDAAGWQGCRRLDDGAHIALALRRLGEARQRGIEQDAEDGRVVGPHILALGRGFVDDLLGLDIAHDDAHGAVVLQRRLVEHHAAAKAPCPKPRP
jgi:hypothetical protein